jgi:hypothetical protein
MFIGTRVLYPEEIQQWDAEMVQVSVYQGMHGNMDLMKGCAQACREAGIPFVIHPVGYSLLQDNTLPDIIEMADHADRALILHDEKSPDGRKLEGRNADRFRGILKDLASLAHISFENATDTKNVQWFWNTFAESITLDIGHVESSGLDSLNFVASLDEISIRKVQFVHIHRNNGLHGGITDHWAIHRRCREFKALRELVTMHPDVSVILEINETETIAECLDLLRTLRDELHV